MNSDEIESITKYKYGLEFNKDVHFLFHLLKIIALMKCCLDNNIHEFSYGYKKSNYIGNEDKYMSVIRFMVATVNANYDEEMLIFNSQDHSLRGVFLSKLN
jgi:hypothetical protein